MFIAASSATRYRNTYGMFTGCTKVFSPSGQTVHLHSRPASKDAAANVEAGFPSDGESKLPHLVQTWVYNK